MDQSLWVDEGAPRLMVRITDQGWSKTFAFDLEPDVAIHLGVELAAAGMTSEAKQDADFLRSAGITV